MMKRLIWLSALCLFSFPTFAFSCKMDQEVFEKRSKTEVKKFIKEKYPEAVVDSISVLRSGRVRVATKSPIPRLYRAVYSADCQKATVNIIQKKDK